MEVEAILAQARDAMTVKRVFGEPIERDGLTIIPVANVMGGAGGGSGQGPFPVGEGPVETGVSTSPSGAGVGFGVRATPAGVYVIRNGEVDWEPAMDMTRIAIMGQIVGIVCLLVVRSIMKARAR